MMGSSVLSIQICSTGSAQGLTMPGQEKVSEAISGIIKLKTTDKYSDLF